MTTHIAHFFFVAALAVAWAATPAHAGWDTTVLAPKASSRASAHKTAGNKFLRERAAEDGVVLDEATGLLYRVLESGPEGAPSPEYDTPCDCHYKGQLIDGTVFDSSYDRGAPATFAPNEVIKGWREALQRMKEGDVWELYLPSDLAYGDRGAGKTIPGGATLVFKIELLKVHVGQSALGGGAIKLLMKPLFLFLRVWHVLGAGLFFLIRGLASIWSGPGGGDVRRRCAKDTRAAASHVLVERNDICAELQKRIDAGTLTFEQAAQRHSACPSGKRDDGYLGWFGPGRLCPELDTLVFNRATEVGTIVGPVKTPFGWHLLRVEGREKLPGEWPVFPKPTATGKRESPSRYFERPGKEARNGGGGGAEEDAKDADGKKDD